MKEHAASRLMHDSSSKEVLAASNASWQASPSAGSLPQGVIRRSLQTCHDERGSLTELFRASWDTGMEVVQWNYAESEAGVLRGVHVHARHADYLILLRGRAVIGLRDLRSGSPTESMSALVEMQGTKLHALTIPPGVAHGFYFPEPSAHLYAVTEYWDPKDELGCHWADAELEINWPMTAPVISARDAGLPSLRELVESLRRGRQT
ncbi:MAG TPA: dTDP-4-dehydrorhamnose 3,5-epimerase family protein [Pyrinomonadaceae bacterium]|jgi:dTDP-4-dehydrorhamnose 3,5-epimerase